jgi:hypothetical protein
MLDVTAGHNVVEQSWDSIEIKTRLPEEMDDFFEPVGLLPHHRECRRAYQRFFIRGKAILRWQDQYFGVYSADASRQGVRFLAPVAMPLNERARIRLPNTKEFQIEIVRCHRMDECCYDCGAIFVLGK